MLSKYGNCRRLLKIKNKRENRLLFTNKVETNYRYFVGVFNKTIVLLALVGYEVIIANSALRRYEPRWLSIMYLIPNAHSWNNCQLLIA